jgi:hypothetical protein
MRPSNLFLRPLDLFLFEKTLQKIKLILKVSKNVLFFSQ